VSDIKRVRDWRRRLSDLIEERRRIPYSEENNCGMFLADCINAMTGVDLAAPYRGKFKTLAVGMALLRRDGYDDLCALLAAHLEEIPPAFARAGDVMAFVVDGTGWAGGIVNGDRVTVMRVEGLATTLRDLGDRAFRVP
jgi:hypothetical protein